MRRPNVILRRFSADVESVVKDLRNTLNQKGQGAVEYILLIGLTVAIVLGIILQFNNAFKVFANNYFGDYLTCLLETGALPSLGGGDTTGGECQVKPFSLAEGGGDGGDGSGGGEGGGGDDEDGDDSKDAPKKTPPPTAGADGGSGSSGSVGSRARNGTRFPARGSGSGDEDGNTKSGEESTSASFNSYDRNKDANKRFLVVESDAKRKRRLEDKKENVRTKVKSDKTLADGRQGAPLLQKVVKRTPASDTDEGGFEFSFGNIFRWLLIIALIIAIVIFIGGQILQVSKSVD